MRTDTSGRFVRVKPESPKPIELQKIITLRVLCMTEGGWPGEDVAAALVGSDLVHGRYGVFHRLHADGRTVFYVASLVEPGSFDPAQMPEQRFPGLSIFAVLPGPMEPVATMDLLYATARQLATDLAGMMQDGKVPAIEAALVKDLGTFFQQELPEAARLVAEPDAASEDDLADFLDIAQMSTLMSPTYTIQGGTTQVLRGIVARGLGLR